jgi:hypothetical protein
MLKRLTLLALAVTVPVLAQDVPLPAPRPDATTPPAEASTEPVPEAAAPLVPLPRARPGSLTAAGAVAVTAPAETGETEPIEPKIYQTACPAVMDGRVVAKALPPIHEGQCGLQSPLSLEAVAANGRSIPLNAAVTTDCGMATALPAWIEEVDSYIFAHDKTRIETINVSTNYACRNVDNAKTGNLSFHAFADALDIIGFTLADGRTISIEPGWYGTPEQGSQILRFARDSACTHFMTVLGPEADSFHQDNMHLDLACHGKACTTRLCQ